MSIVSHGVAGRSSLLSEPSGRAHIRPLLDPSAHAEDSHSPLGLVGTRMHDEALDGVAHDAFHSLPFRVLRHSIARQVILGHHGRLDAAGLGLPHDVARFVASEQFLVHHDECILARTGLL